MHILAVINNTREAQQAPYPWNANRTVRNIVTKETVAPQGTLQLCPYDIQLFSLE
jgi:hypothetical protein